MQRILVIDDEMLVREALQRVLSSTTVSVIAAADAAEGLAMLRESPVDLVIIDVVLPGMDGVAAIKEIRRRHPELPIIAISGGGDFGLNAYRPESISTIAYLAACTAAGAQGVLAKPFETAELRSLIVQVLAPV
jgi:two-component system, chemotaxis family, chemotaxis protein CheY